MAENARAEQLMHKVPVRESFVPTLTFLTHTILDSESGWVPDEQCDAISQRGRHPQHPDLQGTLLGLCHQLQNEAL